MLFTLNVYAFDSKTVIIVMSLHAFSFLGIKKGGSAWNLHLNELNELLACQFVTTALIE